MKTRVTLACFAGAPLLMAASPEPEPVRLKPSSQWVIDYAENACQLIRTFGEGEQKTVLLLQSTTPDTATMVISGKPLKSFRTEVPVRFQPGGAEAIGHGTISGTGDPGVLWNHVPLWQDPKASGVDPATTRKEPKRGVRPEPIDSNGRADMRQRRLAFALAATEIQIETRRQRPVILETGSLGRAVKMFDECGRDSLRDWGLDPDVQDKIVRPVWVPNLLKWFTSDIYPVVMALDRKESAVSARLIVDAGGKVTSCTSLSHFDTPEFNKTVCDVFKRVKFEPAELADGTKVPSYYSAHIMFRTAR